MSDGKCRGRILGVGLRWLGEAALEADTEGVGVESSVIWVESQVDTERKGRDPGPWGNPDEDSHRMETVRAKALRQACICV